MFSFVDRCTVVLPTSARLVSKGKPVTESAETAHQFGEGDRVSISLGYNGVLKNEFEGFVSRVNFTSPVQVECEGYSWQLRQRTYLKTFVNTELVDVLEYLVQGTDIVLDKKNIPGFRIDKIVLQNHNGVEALEELKKISNKTMSIFFTGNSMYAGLQYLNPKADVKYKMRWNVINDGNLKLKEAKNQDVIINYIGEKKDGTKVNVKIKNKIVSKDKVVVTSAKAGDSGETKIIKSHAVTDEATLMAMAQAKLQKLSFNGYEGKITTFGIPYCEPGYRAILLDDKYTERSGNYLVESVEVTYGAQGFRRNVGIGLKL